MRHTFAAIIATVMLSGTAIAQAPSVIPAAKASTSKPAIAKPAKAPVVRTAKSLDCSKQADAKGLHGKPRKSFMSSCKKA